MNTKHRLELEWRLNAEADFASGKFNRSHQWRLDNGQVLSASSSPLIIPEPLSAADALNPQQAFIGALASCHMLAFLTIAAKRKYLVSQYQDSPVGELGTMPDGTTGIRLVTLYPMVSFSGDKQPTSEQLTKLHQMAHKACYIANSVASQIHIQPQTDIQAE
ncbi:OsmC family protein [Shewanella sp. GXUN23E]|uniref:OsmC family protein n=1 Tax=Shewanella sp. GXUN23E TaxID=3422498 RepID=UPI003D7F0F2B